MKDFMNVEDRETDRRDREIQKRQKRGRDTDTQRYIRERERDTVQSYRKTERYRQR